MELGVQFILIWFFYLLDSDGLNVYCGYVLQVKDQGFSGKLYRVFVFTDFTFWQKDR